jgi:hypothetical protein
MFMTAAESGRRFLLASDRQRLSDDRAETRAL